MRVPDRKLVGFALVLFAVVFFCGLFTVCPTIYWRDAPEFVDVVQTYGIPHPAGSPAYILLAKISTFFPLGNLALRVNMISVCGLALSAVLFFFSSFHLSEKIFGASANRIPKLFAVFVVSLHFALSPSLWLTSSFAEVYTLNSAFLAGLILCMVLFWSKKDARFLFLGSFLYGVSAGVHATVVFYLPAFLLFFILFVKKQDRGRFFIWTCLLFLTGFSVFFYLPIRSLANPPFDWGNPETFKQFFIHITDRKTQDSHFQYTQTFSFFMAKCVRYFQHAHAEIGWFGILPALVGLRENFRTGRKILACLFLLYLGNVIFFLNWKTGDGFIPSNLILSLWSSLGLCKLFIWLEKVHITNFGKIFQQVRWERMFALSLLLFCLTERFLPGIFPGLPAFLFADRSNFYNAYDTAKSEYEKMPFDSMVISTLLWFPFRFFQDVERNREDLSVVMGSDVIAPKYFNPITKERFPKLQIPPEDPLLTPWYEYMPELINLNIVEREVYYEPSFSLLRPIHANLATDLFLFRVISGSRRTQIPKEEVDRYQQRLNFLLRTQTDAGAFDIDVNSREYYMSFLLFTGNYFLLQNQDQQAYQVLRLASELRPNQGMVEYYLGITELKLGAFYEARRRLLGIAESDPSFLSPNMLLATNTLRYGALDEAKTYLLKMGQDQDLEVQRGLLWVEYYWRSGNLERARESLAKVRSASHFQEDESDVKLWTKVLNDATI